MGWNGLDLLNDFSAELGDTSSAFKTKVLRWINEGIRDISTSHQWSFLRERAKVVLLADEDTHAIPLAKPAAPSVAALAGGALALTYEYKALVTFYEGLSGVESIAGTASAGVTPLLADLSIRLSNIPVSTSPLVTARKIYVSKGGGAFAYYGAISNNLEATAAVAASLTAQGVTYTAITAGTGGNSITVEIVDTTSGGLSYTEIGGAIIIDLGGATADIDDIVTLLASSAFVDAAGTGASAVGVAAQQSLANGAAAAAVTYDITADTTSVLTPPEENAIHMIDGDFYLEDNRIIQGTSLQDLIFRTNAISSSGTPEIWAPINQEEIKVYPSPNADTTASFYFFKLPARVFGISTSVPEIPSWLYEDLRNYVIWRGFAFRDRAGKESMKLNYDQGLRLTISRKGKPVKRSGRVRCVTPDSDGNGV